MKRLFFSYDKYRCRMLSFVFVMLIPILILLAGTTAYMKTVRRAPKKPPVKKMRQLPKAKSKVKPIPKKLAPLPQATSTITPTPPVAPPTTTNQTETPKSIVAPPTPVEFPESLTPGYRF